MDNEQIEFDRSRLVFEEVYARNNPKRKFNRAPGNGYHQQHAHLCWFYWMAAKKDSKADSKVRIVSNSVVQICPECDIEIRHGHKCSSAKQSMGVDGGN